MTFAPTHHVLEKHETKENSCFNAAELASLRELSVDLPPDRSKKTLVQKFNNFFARHLANLDHALTPLFLGVAIEDALPFSAD